MNQILSLQQYTDIVKNVRRTRGSFFSNNYNTLDSIKRFINLGRLYYHETIGGIIFLSDENIYYKAYLYLDSDKDFTVPDLDKKILVRNVYRANSQTGSFLNVEKRLQKLNFYKEDTFIQVCGNVEKIFSNLKSIERHIKKLENAGYRCIPSDESLINDMDKLFSESDMIKPHHINYMTLEEKYKQPGTYLGLINPDNKICAVCTCVCNNSNQVANAYGITIDEKYKMHGLAPVLTYYRFKLLMEQNVSVIQGWILINNTKSINYHTSLGYYTTDKYADDWILEPKHL